MKLEDLGYTPALEHHRKEHRLEGFDIGRVSMEHRERYLVRTAGSEYNAEIIGNLRYSVQDRSELPVVGDWVAISVFDAHKALIHAVLPRTSLMERQRAGKQGEKQPIAANIDCAFIVVAADRDFSINRIERYLTICHAAGVQAVVLLNKTDLLRESEVAALVKDIQDRIRELPVVPVSAETGEGHSSLLEFIEKGRSYCLLGSSGVGKSTLVNRLSGRSMMKTGSISRSTSKGQHVTTHRELVVLENGGILIDNPGMREVGIADSGEGLEATFWEIAGYAGQCRFKDCTHTTEAGCAVLEAVSSGELDESAYHNYLKLKKESEHFEMTLAEKRYKDKAFGKLLKHYKKLNP